MSAASDYEAEVTRWRTVLEAKLLGARSEDDPVVRAVRDLLRDGLRVRVCSCKGRCSGGHK